MINLKSIFFKVPVKYYFAALVLIVLFSGYGIINYFIDSPINITLDTTNNTFVETYLGEVKTLNPLFIEYDSPEEDISSLIFSSILIKSGDEYIGDLVSYWDVEEDGKTYNFVLKDDVYWHDGVKLTVEDIIFSLWLIKDDAVKTRYGDIFKDIKIEKLSENKFKIITDVADIYFIENFDFPILPKHLLDDLDTKSLLSNGYNLNPIGSGKYIFQSINVSSNETSVFLKKNKAYYGDLPQIENIRFDFYKNFDDIDQVKTTAFSVEPRNIPVNLNDYNEYLLPLTRYQILFFNNDSETLKSNIVRKAIHKALSFNDFAQGYKVKIINSPYLYEQSGIVQQSNDGDGPKELLYSAGWQIYSKEFSDGLRRNVDKEKMSINIVTVDSPMYLTMCEYIKKKLSEIGIEVTYAGFSESDLSLDLLNDRSFDMLLLGINLSNREDLYPILHSFDKNEPNKLNFSNYDDLETDLLLEDLRNTVEARQRDKIKLEIMKRLDRDVPIIFISQGLKQYYAKKSVTNVVIPEIMSRLSERFLKINEWKM